MYMKYCTSIFYASMCMQPCIGIDIAKSGIVKHIIIIIIIIMIMIRKKSTKMNHYIWILTAVLNINS